MPRTSRLRDRQAQFTTAQVERTTDRKTSVANFIAQAIKFGTRMIAAASNIIAGQR